MFPRKLPEMWHYTKYLISMPFSPSKEHLHPT